MMHFALKPLDVCDVHLGAMKGAIAYGDRIEYMNLAPAIRVDSHSPFMGQSFDLFDRRIELNAALQVIIGGVLLQVREVTLAIEESSIFDQEVREGHQLHRDG